MGVIHALHVNELAREEGRCELAALVDAEPDRARRFAASIGSRAPVFSSLKDLIDARVCSATVLVTPTDRHREHATELIRGGHRVLMEKPLTGNVESDSAFAAELDRDHPDAMMLGFQRRFDEPLVYAKSLMDSGAIGRVFKIYSSLEDSAPPPNGYRSGGILSDMSIHNVDEILWLAGRSPSAALAIGANVYSHKLTTCEEDYDDALLYMWFDDESVAQVQVSRNHVSGYRVESILFGEKGQIRIGSFDQRLFDISVEVYGPRGMEQPLAQRTFKMRRYEGTLPEFADRFGPAYKTEVATFIACCAAGKPFPVTHRDGLRAQQVIAAGMRAVISRAQAARV
jgi:predicted dehydrogenase